MRPLASLILSWFHRLDTPGILDLSDCVTYFNFSCCFFIDSDDAIAYSQACGLGRESHTFLHSLDLFLLQYENSITKVKTIERPQARTCFSIFHRSKLCMWVCLHVSNIVLHLFILVSALFWDMKRKIHVYFQKITVSECAIWWWKSIIKLGNPLGISHNNLSHTMM